MADGTGDAGLSVAEGVLLGHALVARVAKELGIRVFFIKGPASVLRGLRSPKTSTDVDVFVAPADLDELLQCLLKRGWRERPVDLDWPFPRHSVTIHHLQWPCCIDIHFRFPGMENSPEDCFELMWAHTEDFTLAGRGVRVPSAPMGIVILALHALRAPSLPASRQELDYLASLAHKEKLETGVLDLAVRVGAQAAMRPFLAGILQDGAAPAWPVPSTEWRYRMLAKEPGSARLLALAQAPWRGKFAVLLRALYPPPGSVIGEDFNTDVSIRAFLATHRARWTRFLRALPRIARDFTCAK